MKKSPHHYFAPWEKAFLKVLTPFEEFIHRQTTTGILLIFCAMVALIIANTPLLLPYDELLHTKIGLFIGSWKIEHSVHHWINDGLMAIFFFVVGMEIKREILVGELSNLRNATLPIIGAISGMLLPALFYWFINPEGSEARGWGIPMATDIAFAVGVMALLGSRIPRALLTFLVALAIVDDLGAVTVIALFYTDSIDLGYLAGGAFFTLTMVGCNLAGVRNPLPYFLLGLLLWIAMEGSGIHATIAGVIGALTIPAYARFRPSDFSNEIRTTLEQFDRHEVPDAALINNPHQSSLAWKMSRTFDLGISPLQRLESAFHIPSTYLVIPLFALANAAIPLDGASILMAIDDSVAMGIAAGLVLGKVIGVAGSVLLFWKLGFGELPRGTTPSHIIGAGLLAGIGFTMSIFISELAFAWDGEQVVLAKMGILAASLVAGITGFAWLRWIAPAAREATD
jgi:NhaA family Na+:H+ antiporter